MDKIKDIRNYPKVVPTVKKVDVYSQITHKNGIFLLTYLLTHSLTYYSTLGTVQEEAEFSVGISIATFGYFLVLTYEPKYNTYFWTLDYKYTRYLLTHSLTYSFTYSLIHFTYPF